MQNNDERYKKSIMLEWQFKNNSVDLKAREELCCGKVNFFRKLRQLNWFQKSTETSIMSKQVKRISDSIQMRSDMTFHHVGQSSLFFDVCIKL
jgi:hypothetical protein